MASELVATSDGWSAMISARMRRAAEKILWDSTFLQESDFPELQNERRQKECVADLLLAIAHEADMFNLITPSPARWDSLGCVFASAKSLADVILEERK